MLLACPRWPLTKGAPSDMQVPDSNYGDANGSAYVSTKGMKVDDATSSLHLRCIHDLDVEEEALK